MLDIYVPGIGDYGRQERTNTDQNAVNLLVDRVVPDFRTMTDEWAKEIGVYAMVVSRPQDSYLPTQTIETIGRTIRLLTDNENGYNIEFKGNFMRFRVPHYAFFAWSDLFIGMKPSLQLLNGSLDTEPIVIPMSPVLDFTLFPDMTAEVWTRFTGLPIGYFNDVLFPRLRKALRDTAVKTPDMEKYTVIIKNRIEQLEDEIHDQKERILQQLTELYYNHGRFLHEGHFSLEFIKAEFIDEMFAKGFTINTLPYEAGVYGQSPEAYLRGAPVRPIVRLVNFDQAILMDPEVEKKLTAGRVHPTAETLMSLLSSHRPYENALAGTAAYIFREELDWPESLVELSRAKIKETPYRSGGLRQLVNPSAKWSREDVRAMLREDAGY